MKGHAMKSATLIIASAALCAASLAVAAKDTPPPEAGVVAATEPGKGVVAGVVDVTATVESVDKAGRHLTIKGPHGRVSSLTAGPEVRNFDQINVGDHVKVRYAQALTLTLVKEGKKMRSRTETMDGGGAPAGERPAGVVGQKIEITADVTGVNRKTGMVTLRGPDHSVDMQVRDPAQLKLIKVGDQVHAVYTEAVALQVEAAPKKK
jgi:Cu/Ag efflux protein CusF